MQPQGSGGRTSAGIDWKTVGPHAGVDGSRLGSTQWQLPSGATPGLNEAAAYRAAARGGVDLSVMTTAAGRAGGGTSIDPNVLASAVQRGVEAALRPTGGIGGSATPRGAGGLSGASGGRSGGHTSGRGAVPVIDEAEESWLDARAKESAALRGPGELDYEKSQWEAGSSSAVPDVPTSWSAGGPSSRVRRPSSGGYGPASLGPRAARSSRFSTAFGRHLSEAGRKSWAPPVVSGWRMDDNTGEVSPYYSKRVQGSDGNYSNVDISKEEYGTLSQRGNFLNSVTGALQGYGEGGVVGAAQGAAPKAASTIGVLSAIPTSAFGVGAFLSTQRQANAAYQSIYGGSNMSGMGNRIREMEFRYGQLGTLSGAQANEAFMGVSQAGLSGGERDKAVNLAVDSYKKLGASIAQSVQAVTIAAQAGNKQLTGLASAITSVSTAASQAGTNANVARQNFLTAYGNVSSSITGPQAPAIAAGIAGAQANLGSNYQGINMSQGFTSTQTQRLMAANLGLTLNQFTAKSMGSGGASFYGQAESQTTISMLSSLGWLQLFQPFANMVLQAAKQENRQPNQNDFTNATTAALQAPNMPDVGAVQQVFSNILGQDFNGNTEAAYEFIIRAIVGQMSPSTVGGWNPTQATANAQKQAGSSSVTSSSAQKSAMAAAGNTKSSIFSSGTTNQRAADQQWYKTNVVQNQKKQDPILAELLKNFDAKGALYQVQTKNGTTVVNMSDLEKYYADQVQAGTVQVVSGQYAGQSVAQLTGMTPSQGDISAASGPGGSATKAAMGKNRSGQASSGGKSVVVIQPTPLLQKYLTFLSGGANAVSSQYTANNVPPPSSVQPGLMPGALNQ